MKGNMTQMDEVKEGVFEALPKGWYTFLVQTKDDKTSSNGDPMIAITLEVADGPSAGRLVWDNILLSANPDSPGWKIRWRAKMFLKAIGEAHNGDNFEWDSDRWPYCKCLGLIDHEPKKDKAGNLVPGQMRAVIKQYKALEPSAVSAQTPKADSDVPF